MELSLLQDYVVPLVTLTVLEIVLGIDNIIFIAILVAKVEPSRREFARRTGLLLAMGTRILLLCTLTWIMGLTKPFLTILGHGITGRDVILIGGGLFLLAKSTMEIHDKLEGGEEETRSSSAASLGAILFQIALLDIVFSLDSVITAVGMAQQLWIMITAVVIAVFVMMFFARAVGDFVNDHPTMKILALSFLILIGVLLIAEGMGKHVDRGYVYFAMAFSVFVECLNMRVRPGTAVRLRGRADPALAVAGSVPAGEDEAR